MGSSKKHLVDTGHTVGPMTAFKILLRVTTGRFLRFVEAAAIWRGRPGLCKQLDHVTKFTLPWPISD
ncbi:hypothetical protein SprV_0802558500 [Sparganum proliferum]